jgi:hypothetical protein
MPRLPASKKYTCAACGYRKLEFPQRNASGGASHEICPSCGFESGYTDDELEQTFETWRQEWVDKGLPWSSKGYAKPENWNPVKDLQALTKRRRPVVPAHILAKKAPRRSSTKKKAAE